MKSLTDLTGDITFVALNAAGWGSGSTWPLAVKALRDATRRVPDRMVLMPSGTEFDGVELRYPLTATWQAFVIRLT